MISGRVANVKRETKETKVEVSLTLDGTGVCTANTPVHFLNHMLDVSSQGRNVCGEGQVIMYIIVYLH